MATTRKRWPNNALWALEETLEKLYDAQTALDSVIHPNAQEMDEITQVRFLAAARGSVSDAQRILEGVR